MYTIRILGSQSERGNVIRVGERTQLNYPTSVELLFEVVVNCLRELFGYRVVGSLDFDLKGTFVPYADTKRCNVGQELSECRVGIVPELMEDTVRFEWDRREEGGVTGGDEVV